MSQRSRRGFSLIEMLMATAILLVSIGVLTELAEVGRVHARGAEEAATAQRLCQNLLEEMLCGSMPLRSASDVVTPDDPDWNYSVEIKPLDQFQWNPRIAEVRVTVVKTPANSETVARSKPGRSFSLSRWIRYPADEKSENDSEGDEEDAVTSDGENAPDSPSRTSRPRSSTEGPAENRSGGPTDAPPDGPGGRSP